MMGKPTPVIALENLSKSYFIGEAHFDVLKNLSFMINKNEFVAITGPSGSGKSTLLNIIGCLDIPHSGTYDLNGVSVFSSDERQLAAIRNHQIGFVFQTFNLLPRKSALQNVMQPLRYRPMSNAERIERALVMLEEVGLKDRANHIPSQLSGGQRQRVAIARALVIEPALLIADEPTGNLDSSTTAEIMALFHQLHNIGNTIVMVTHEPEIAAQCQRLVRLEDGTIVKDTLRHGSR